MLLSRVYKMLLSLCHVQARKSLTWVSRLLVDILSLAPQKAESQGGIAMAQLVISFYRDAEDVFFLLEDREAWSLGRVLAASGAR